MSYILLVEDNEDNAAMVIRLLEGSGYEVRHSLKGLDAVRIANQETPGLILMDFNLPDIDGRTLVLTLKKRLASRAGTAPPVVAITARAGLMEEVIAERFGCDAFVSKPFDPQEFIKLVNGFLPVPNPDVGS